MQVREQERRAEEQRRAKQAADEEWRRAQHERELQRRAAEEALEREAKVGSLPSLREERICGYGTALGARQAVALARCSWL